MFDVFISYSTQNVNAALEVCRSLEEAGSVCWMAPRDILPGSHFAASITQAIRNARVLVLMFSMSANDSEQVLHEVDLADKNRVPIVTVMLEQVEINDAFSYYLSTTQRFSPSGDSRLMASQLTDVVRRVLQAKEAASHRFHTGVLIDIYDSEMNWAGTALRNQVHKMGFWHKTCHCWFYGMLDEKPVLYVQKRSQKKSDFPGLLDITFGRHLLAGETDSDAINKMRLELGVDVGFQELQYLGVRTYAEHIAGFFNNEFNSVYLCRSIRSLSDFSPNPDEVSGVVQMDAASALALFDGQTDQIEAVGIFTGDTHRQEALVLRREDFVPRADNYYQRICASIVAVATGIGKAGL